MKLISWNVNGLRACMQKGFLDWFNTSDADIFCIQESKLQEGQVELDLPGYEQYWNCAEKKGYSGTAVFTRVKPLQVTYGIGIEEHDHEGRVITLEFGDFFLVNCYTPNSRNELVRLDYRMQWEDDFREYLCRLAEKKGVVLCGDLNVAHEEIDLKNPKTNRRNAGFTDEEREKMTRLLDAGFIDTWRYFEPETEGILDCLRENQIGFISFSPLAQGLLTDRYLNGIPAGSRMTENRFLKKEVLDDVLLNRLRLLNEMALQRGETLAQMALAWILNHPATTSVLVGASSVNQMEKNLCCMHSSPFSKEELHQVETILSGH